MFPFPLCFNNVVDDMQSANSDQSSSAPGEEQAVVAVKKVPKSGRKLHQGPAPAFTSFPVVPTEKDTVIKLAAPEDPVKVKASNAA